MNFELRTELFERADRDQALRNKMIETNDMADWDESIDQQNTAWLKGIVEQSGWPLISAIGPDGSQAAWLLVQHADHDPEFQASCLNLMKALPADEVAPRNIAYLEDRVRIAQGRPQLYGTQFFVENGAFGARPIEDQENLEQRRAAIGLEPFEEYKKLIMERHTRNND